MKDSSKFKNIPVAPDKDLNYIINFEKRVTELLKKFKNKNAIGDETYNKQKPVGWKPGTLYGSAKVHKPPINGLPPFRPILERLVPQHTNKTFSSCSVWYNIKWV